VAVYSLLPTSDRPPIYVPRVLRDLGFDPTGPLPRPDQPPKRPAQTRVRSDSPLAVLDPEAETAEQPLRQSPIISPNAAPQRAIPVPRPAVSREFGADPPAGLTLFDLLGPGAVLLGIAAAICAWTGRIPALIVPFAAVGLFLGLLNVLLTGGVRGSRLWPLSGVLLSGAVLAIVLIPGLSGIFGHRAKAPTPGVFRVIPLVGHELPEDLTTAEWVDAGRAALQQDQVGVQVTGVTLGPVEVLGAQRKRTVTPEKYLVVRVRARRVAGQLRLRADKEDEPDPVFERPRAVLSDEAGTIYQAAPIEIESDSGPMRGPSEEAFLFEAPAAGAKLRLEIPAKAWGGAGSFRFALPSSMIRPGVTRGGRL
jgi:hypothetical protein